MNYYAPREIMDKDGKPTGRWHYTIQNDNDIHTIGYCSPWESCPDCTDLMPKILGGSNCSTCNGTRLVKRSNPCPGHDTPEAACEHQKQWELDHAQYHPDTEDARSKSQMLGKCHAENCPEFTCGYAFWGHHRSIPLCNEHNNRKTLEKLIEVNESWSS